MQHEVSVIMKSLLQKVSSCEPQGSGGLEVSQVNETLLVSDRSRNIAHEDRWQRKGTSA